MAAPTTKGNRGAPSLPARLARLRLRLSSLPPSAASAVRDGRALYLAGPVLVAVATAVIAFLLHAYASVILPMLAGVNWIANGADLRDYRALGGPGGERAGDGEDEELMRAVTTIELVSLSLRTVPGVLHTSVVVFFAANIVYNYYMCVTTDNAGPARDGAAREMAAATGFDYPETEEDVESFRREVEGRIRERLEERRRRASAGGSGRGGRRAEEEEADERFYTVTLPVIPGIDWGTDGSFRFCFVKGLEAGGPAERCGEVAPGDFLCQLTGREGGCDGGGPHREDRQKPLDRSIRLVGEPWDQVVVALTSFPPGTTHMDLVLFRGTKSQLRVACASGKYGSRYTSPSSARRQIHDVRERRKPRVHGWQLLDHDEWGWCRKSGMPKPPRSHYDNITRALVLNMDHYCPWMFNCVGYFNYRYFCNFTWYVAVILAYGACISFRPFRNLLPVRSGRYLAQVRAGGGAWIPRRGLGGGGFRRSVRHYAEDPYVPIPDEWWTVFVGFLLCLFFCLFVSSLVRFHARLVLTGQTSIEYLGAGGSARRGGNGLWTNPYGCAGGWRANWTMVYGAVGCGGGVLGMAASMLPSSREPEHLPMPFGGRPVRRRDAAVVGRRRRAEGDGDEPGKKSEEIL